MEDRTAKRVGAIILLGALVTLVVGLTTEGDLPLVILMLLIAVATFAVVKGDRSQR